MNTLYIDLETYSPIDLKTCGVYKYTEQVEILLFTYALNDGPVNVWDCTKDKTPPDLIIQVIRDKSIHLCAHNSGFDRVVLNRCASGLTYNRLWRDTMVRALAHGLPGGLMVLSEIFKLPIDKAKDKAGHTLIHLFCKPQKAGSRATRVTHPKEWVQFVDYARLDIEAMRILDKKLPVWNDTDEERALWYLDQKINDRGFAVDSELAKAAIQAVEKEKLIRNAATQDATDGTVNAATQRDALLKYILEIHGVDLPNMQIGTLTRRLEDPDLPEPVKELIQLRLESSGTSTKKYSTLLKSVCSDGRLRGGLQFCGASRTGRWSGRIFQPHNLPRPKYKKDDIEIGIGALKTGCADLLYENVTSLASSAIRGIIVAPKGKKLVISDLSGIEGRMLAWLAGEEWKIKAYYDFDAGRIQNDMYELTYARTFNIYPCDVDDDKRKLGKVLELAMGYGGGVGAFVTFANGYKVDLEDMTNRVWSELPEQVVDEASDYWAICVKERKTLGLSEKVFVACDSIKRLWREANPAIVQFWKDLQDAAYQALLYDRVIAGKHFQVDKKGTWLRIRLPSGRYVCYAGAKIEEKKIRYLGINQYTRKWCKLSTYGGKSCENATQGAARDILAHGMRLAENAGYKIVLSVHDELLTEVPDSPEFNHETLSKIMSTNPPWAPELPLAAAGFEAYRYRKD